MSDGFEWLDWLEPSGPFLAAPVLKKTFPQGLDLLDPNKKRALRQAYDEYRQALDEEDPEADKFQAAWIALVLREGLEYDEDESGDNLKAAEDLPDSLVSQVAEHGITLKPDFAVVEDQNADKPMMLIQGYAQDVDLNDAVRSDGWASSPKERMVRLCRDTGTRLGLVTNGEHWLFVDAPVGAVSSFASWYARLWGQEPVLLQAFVALLGIRRFFGDADEKLPALIDKSVEFQDEVTEALGEQVRRAVEVLIQALDKADLDRNRELLKDVDPRELYEAGLTVMMRLVFLLSAEERDLLLLGDEHYEANYAVSTLRMQLRGEDDAILQRRWDAWSRLLAIFRAIYGGIEHETLRMPALGGSLFDPDRYPFLEGRDKDSSWKADPAKPLPIDNQTVLLLLDAIQMFEGRTLSYRGLDIEQLGYVYEGLLDHTVKRAKEVTLELDPTKSAKQPWATLGELESARLDGETAVEELLKERTGSSISRVRNDLKKEVKPQQSMSLLTACHNDQALHDQLKQYFHLIRTDSWSRPLVYPEGSFMVTTGEDRRTTGSHYTPTSLTEAIVRETLEPVVYIGPSEGKPRAEWQLKLPKELLNLKICDPAMGSGAFLVQVCRWLGQRIVEAWSLSERAGNSICIDGAAANGNEEAELMPRSSEERDVIARRLVAERCIYGVDLNPLAVELAKLSVWLVTLAKGRPFGFLDHALKCGDTLLGVHDINQVLRLSFTPSKGQQQLFSQNIQEAVAKARDVRRELRSQIVRDIRDVEKMADLEADARRTISLPQLIADSLVGAYLAHGPSADLTDTAILAGAAISGDAHQEKAMSRRAKQLLSVDLHPDKNERHPFHWPLEFPEVFDSEGRRFDCIVGNPPFMSGTHISNNLGAAYREYLAAFLGRASGGRADLVAYFFLRAYRLLRDGGCLGLIATNTIAEGDTRQVSLEPLLAEYGATIHAAYTNQAWPGAAAVVTSRVHLRKGGWEGVVTLNGDQVSHISAFLSAQDEWSLKPLNSNANIAAKGSDILGMGFTISKQDAGAMISEDGKNRDVLFPFLNGRDLNSHPNQSPSRWIINFFDWPEERAKTYRIPYKHILEHVRPEREKDKKKPAREFWWRYWRIRSALYHRISRGHSFESHPNGWDRNLPTADSVLAITVISRSVAFAFVPNDAVFSAAINIFNLNSYSDFACLQSSIHVEFAWKHASKMKNDLRYTLTDVFQTFPRPEVDAGSQLEQLGKEYHDLRAAIMQREDIGLTKLYNRFHDPADDCSQLVKMRELHRAMDIEVASAYGWHDLDLGHGFVDVDYLPENNRTRYTLPEGSRIQVLNRLTALNKERYAEENPNSPGSKNTQLSNSTTTQATKDEPPLNGQRSLFS